MAKAKNTSTSPTISTSALVSEIATKFTEIPKKMTKELVFSFINGIEEALIKGSKVRIDKLGILQARDRAARKGRNPQTGEQIEIPASKKVAFRAASSLKTQVGIKKKTPTAKPVAAKPAAAKKKK